MVLSKEEVILNNRLAPRKNTRSGRPASKTSATSNSAAKKTSAVKKAVDKRPRKPPQVAVAITAPEVETPMDAKLPASETRPHAWLTAVRAAESKKALDIRVLDLREVTSFCDFFVIASGTNPKQIQAIAEEIDMELRKIKERATSVEGYDNAEWILADYGDFIVHVFSEKAREFYDLERLWRAARVVPIPAA